MLKFNKKISLPSILSRSLSGPASEQPKGGRPVIMILLGVAVVVGIVLLLPRPAPRLREVAISDEDLRQVVGRSRLPPTVRQRQPALAALGRAIFRSSGLSPHTDRTCGSCHTFGSVGSPQDQGLPAASTAAAQPQVGQTTANAPDLAHLNADGWFGRDGRSDSLAAACLEALEDPQGMNGSRLAVLALVKQRFRESYEEAFGAWPANLAGIPEAGRPEPSQAKLPIEVAALGLATLGSFPLLDGILTQANQQHATPAIELSRRAFSMAPVPPQWSAAFASLSPEQQVSANQVFAKVGQALAAFLLDQVSDDSPYDRFAARLLQGRSAQESLDQDFGATELAGLKLFHGPGQCQTCHSGPRFSDGLFHNIGLPQRGTDIAAGRAAGLQIALGDPFNCKGIYLAQSADASTTACQSLRAVSAGKEGREDLGAFRTPTLRNDAKRSSFMHDGRFTSVAEVVTYFNDLEGRPAIGERDPQLHRLDLTDEEMAAIVRFLATLNSPARDLNPSQSAVSHR